MITEILRAFSRFTPLDIHVRQGRKTCACWWPARMPSPSHYPALSTKQRLGNWPTGRESPHSRLDVQVGKRIYGRIATSLACSSFLYLCASFFGSPREVIEQLADEGAGAGWQNQGFLTCGSIRFLPKCFFAQSQSAPSIMNLTISFGV